MLLICMAPSAADRTDTLNLRVRIKLVFIRSMIAHVHRTVWYVVCVDNSWSSLCASCYHQAVVSHCFFLCKSLCLVWYTSYFLEVLFGSTVMMRLSSALVCARFWSRVMLRHYFWVLPLGCSQPMLVNVYSIYTGSFDSLGVLCWRLIII